MVEKGIRGEICYFYDKYTKAYNKKIKDYQETKESQFLNYWDANSFYGWHCHKVCLLMDLSALKKFITGLISI